MIIKTANNIFNYFHLALAAYVISLMVIYYFNLIKLNFNLILGLIILFGILSIVLTVWYKVELRQYFERNKNLLYYYKHSKVVWSAVGIGLTTILIAKDADSELKILTLSIGLYLLVSQTIEFLSGKYFRTNILAFTEDYLIDLNGKIKRIKYKEIKSYDKKSESISIQEKYETFKIKQTNFHEHENMIENIENEFLNNVNKAR